MTKGQEELITQMFRLVDAEYEALVGYSKMDFHAYMADTIPGVTRPMTDEVWYSTIGESKMNDKQIEKAIGKVLREEFPGPHPPVENKFSFSVSQEQDEDDVTLVLVSPEGQELTKKVAEKDGYALLNKMWDAAISEFNTL